MQIRHQRVTINDTTPTLVFSGRGRVRFFGPGSAYLIGGSTLSASNGFRWVNNDELVLVSDTDVYALADSGTQSLQILAVD